METLRTALLAALIVIVALAFSNWISEMIEPYALIGKYGFGL